MWVLCVKDAEIMLNSVVIQARNITARDDILQPYQMFSGI